MTKICIKYRELCEFSIVWADHFWAIVKISAILPKDSTFEGIFLILSWSKKVKT